MKRKKTTTPTQRSLKALREQGYLVAICERWNPFAKIRQDIFGFIDLLAIRENETLAVQTTSDNGGNVSARIEKIRALPAAEKWLESPNRSLQVHGWALKGARNEKKTWTCRIIHFNSKEPNN